MGLKVLFNPAGDLPSYPKIKSDQNGIERCSGGSVSDWQVAEIKSDQNGIESIYIVAIYIK